MKITILKTFTAASITLLFVACKPEIDIPAATKGNIDVSKYVAIGNSHTAGYADNALYNEGQQYSYANLLSAQFKLVSGGDFKTPFVSAASVGIGASQNAPLGLGPVTDCMGAVSLAPVYKADKGDLSIFVTNIAAQGPFNNMGVPGAKVTTVLYPGYGNPANGSGNFNPFFTRMTADPASNSILSDAAAQAPTFFSMYLGHDDVMNYAMSGGLGDIITPSAGAPGSGFDGSVDAILATLTANGSKGVVANLPHLNTIPYFTTVPYNGLLLDQANAAALTAAYTPLGMTFQAGYNGFVIEDAGAPGGMRKIQQGEMVLLSVPQDSLKCAGWGSMKPIPDQYILTATEIANATNAITAYNTKLQSAAAAMNLAFVDVNAFMNTLNTGIMYNGAGISTQFVQGGAYSLDGVHLSPKGHALLANQFIKSINAKYGSAIPAIDATRFRGVVFP